jgi:hypothetical protein
VILIFEKEFTIPTKVLQIEALLNRTSKDYLKRPLIEEKARILRSGYYGEKNLNYFLSLLPEKSYFIFHNLRIPVNSSFFQIDFLLISTKLIIILDAKNHAGTLVFEKNQLIHQNNNIEKIYENPLSQVYRHRTLLKNWLEKYQISSIPIEYYVAVTNSSTKVIISPGYEEGEKRVIRANNLFMVIDALEKKYNKDMVDPKKLTKIKKLLLQSHTPEKINFLELFGIILTEILNGVICPKCSSIPMQYSRNKWKCPTCGYISKDAYLQAINDYFLLIKPSFNNSELQKFLLLPSSKITRKIISKLNLPYSGKNKGRTYYQKSTNHFFPELNKH